MVRATRKEVSGGKEEPAFIEGEGFYRGPDDDDEHENVHIGVRTWLALFAFFFYNFAIVFAIGGPPFVLDQIATTFDAEDIRIWVPNSLSLVQAITAPMLGFVSDMLQSRLAGILVSLALGIIGAAIVPGSQSIGRVIVGQSLMGVTLASITLAYSVPSELLPRRWRPLVQSVINTAAMFGFIVAPFIAAGFIERYGTHAWRYFYWVLCGLFAMTFVLLVLFYHPPPRVSLFDKLTPRQKLQRLDLPGAFLLASGLGLLLAGLNLGGNPRPWNTAIVIALLTVGGVLLVCFGVWEWKGTKQGIFHHHLFSINRNFGLLVILMFMEGFVLFAFVVFYAPMVEAIFEPDLLRTAVYQSVGFSVIPPVTLMCGFIAYKTRRQVEVLAFALIETIAAVLANVQPGDNSRVLGGAALTGIGYSAPLVLVISLTQLSIPKELIATGTAVLTTARGVGAITATAIYSVGLNNRLDALIPQRVGAAAAGAGLPASSIPAFVGALANNNSTALQSVPDTTPAIINAGVAALLQALCDSFRVVYIIAAPVALLGGAITLCLVNVSSRMTEYVDAPFEKGSHTDAELEKKNVFPISEGDGASRGDRGGEETVSRQSPGP